jgi:hypothetical protein
VNPVSAMNEAADVDDQRRRHLVRIPEHIAGTQDFSAAWTTSTETGTKPLKQAFDLVVSEFGADRVKLIEAKQFNYPDDPAAVWRAYEAFASWIRHFVTSAPERRPAQEGADAKLRKLMQADVQRLWVNTRRALDEELAQEDIEAELDLLLSRHGGSGVQALSAAILSRIPSGDVSWKLLQLLGDRRDELTAGSRRDLLAAALESRDAGLRYAAATGLGALGDAASKRALRQRLVWEQNASVRRVIEAELRT